MTMPEIATYANLRAMTVQPDRLLMTKLCVPPVRADRVRRPHLTARLHEGLRHKMLLLSAPAGSGKTMALSEWVEAEQGRQAAIAWVSLDPADNDLARFLTYFIAALQTIQTGIGGVALALLESAQPPALESVLTTLVNELTSVPNDLAVVLDDAHVLIAPDVQRVLTFLLDHLPPHVHLIVASRTEPPLSLARLRARDQVLELHTPDLRFTYEETAAFFRQIMGVNLAPEDIELLNASTEGWAAGLQLAAISLRGEPDISQRIRTFAGDDRYILDFLVSEVLHQQPPDLQTFLLDTSILDRFNAALCTALTGRSDAQRVLEQLEQSNLFIVPLDQVRGWYRYHHLFADLLRDQLRRTQPDRIVRLQRLAQAWYAAQDSAPAAPHHDPAPLDQTDAAAPTPLHESLSDREREILRLIEQGLSNQEIAQRLIVAVSTIKWHINRLYAKLDAHSRTQAIARARQLRLL
jgi:LuxR family maltose regulon positive regulatory protein